MSITTTELERVLDAQTLLELAGDEALENYDANVILLASDHADSEIRKRLNYSDTDPTELPGSLREIWITLTVERLFERRHQSVPTLWKERAARARQLLIPKQSSTTSQSSFGTRTPEDRAHQPSILKKY